MGCCFSSEEDNEDDLDRASRQPLLNPVEVDGPSSRPTGYNSINSSNRPQQKGDEQSALNRILQETASNVIDVAALETHGMDQMEYIERAKQYSHRLSAWCSNTSEYSGPCPLPLGVAAPQTVLSNQPVTMADLQLINAATQQASRCLRDVKVKHKEDLVVPFGVP